MDVMTKPEPAVDARQEKILRIWLWASLICNMGIVVTGGIVRITGSGLGCPTWPRCTDESFVPHGELGLHGAIEFGNRLLTFVLAAVALGAFIWAWRQRGRFSKLWWITFVVGLGIIIQAVVGGLTVWFDLHPAFVAVHLVLSIALITLTTWGVLLGYRKAPTLVDKKLRGLTVATFILVLISIALGTMTTGAGPHAGDANSPRLDIDIEAIARLHSISAWLVTIFVIICVVAFHRANLPHPQRVSLWLLAAVVVQGLIGYIQYFLGVPVGVVWMHMVGLVILTAAAAWQLLATKAESAPA